MRAATFVAVILAGASLTVACSKGPGDRTEAPRASTATPPGPAPSRAAARPARDVCALLSVQEATELTSLPIERVEKIAEGCAWYANAAAQRQSGMASVAGTFEKMSKQEPASADENLRNMETMLKGFVGTAAPGGPLFAVSVQSDGADQAEATLKGTIAVVGAGLPGGKLEPVEGLGDRAYTGPAGSFLYVRKGPLLVHMDLRTFSGTREQAIALARRIVSRL